MEIPKQLSQEIMKTPMEIINYDFIDYGLREIIKWLNNNGLITEWCCSGHEEYKKVCPKQYKNFIGEDYQKYFSYCSYIKFRTKEQANEFFKQFPNRNDCFIFMANSKTIRIIPENEMTNEKINNFWKEVYNKLIEKKENE